jgi:hypothetical protein
LALRQREHGISIPARRWTAPSTVSWPLRDRSGDHLHLHGHDRPRVTAQTAGLTETPSTVADLPVEVGSAWRRRADYGHDMPTEFLRQVHGALRPSVAETGAHRRRPGVAGQLAAAPSDWQLP